MDSDGQHPADLIPAFMAASQAAPEAMVLGKPVFAAECAGPARQWPQGVERLGQSRNAVDGHRRLALRFSRLSDHAADRIMRGNRFMRRFDFDPEAVVRLCWAGVHTAQPRRAGALPSADEGGVSHFRYLRDNTC
jgi:hypothetical protein